MCTAAHTDTHAHVHKHIYTRIGSIYIPAYFFSLIYIVCEWLLHRVGSLVEELGNGPFLRTQWNRSGAAYVGIWMVNRWITQSGVFLCRLAGIVLWYLCVCMCMCVCVRERMGAWRSGDSSFPKVLRSGQKYLQCQEVFWKIFEKIQYRADLLLGICEQIHSPSNLAQSQGGRSVLLYHSVDSKLC